MTKKIFAPLAAVAAVALVAVSLVVSGGTATAAVNGLSVSPTTVDPGATGVVLTIDADNDAGDVRVIATNGDFTDCQATGVACALVNPANLGGSADRDLTIDDTAADAAGGNTDTVQVTWTAPNTGPQTVTFTVTQGTSTRTAAVTVRGTVSTVEMSALTAPSTSNTACTGTVAEVIRSTTATTGQTNATLCTIVRDSAGNRLPNQPVVYSTTAGSLSDATDTTGGTGQVANAVTLAAGSTGTSGTEATITANAGGQTATQTIRFGGNPASCTVTTDPTSVQVGGSSTITVSVKDSANGPVPDGTIVNVQQANPGQGANAAILNPAPTTTGGDAETQAIAAIQGAIAIGAASVVGNASCTGTLIATGTVIPPTGPGTGTGEGGFVAAPSFGTGNVGSAVFNGGSIQQLSEAVTAAGGTAVWAQGTNGNWYRYSVGATGSTAFVNNAFNAQFASGFAGATAVFVVR